MEFILQSFYDFILGINSLQKFHLKCINIIYKLPNYFSGTQTNDNQIANTGDSNDVQVVEEKLTYVNQHAKLSANITVRAFRSVESIIVEKNSETALRTALERVIQHHCNQNKENPPPGNWNKTELLPK